MYSRIPDKAIHDAVAFETATGKKPNIIYLGTSDYEALSRYARECGFFLPIKPSNDRPEWCGMKIFVVDELQHINFGIQIS